MKIIVEIEFNFIYKQGGFVMWLDKKISVYPSKFRARLPSGLPLRRAAYCTHRADRSAAKPDSWDFLGTL